MRTVIDSRGARLTLGSQIARGGEGAIYEITERADLVAKLYLEKPGADRINKLQAMNAVASKELLQIAAWPVSTLSKAPGDQLIGFTMPRVSGKEAHVLYSPKQRQSEFPKADWRFLIWVARNIAAAVATVHGGGHVIGDINQKGFLVSVDATVRLIDCDSFQVFAQGKKYPCIVGVPEFTPPELHGRSFQGIERTPNHDAFGLAVLVFQLLFMGRHPFAGRFLGRGDMPIDRAIREFRFAYSQVAATKEMVPPPHALALSSVSFGVASLFERAFAPIGSHGGRPTARDWTLALESLFKELKTCDVDSGHRFHSSLTNCSWCTIERLGGPAFFVSASATLQTGSATTFNIHNVLAAIRSVRPPALPPSSATASSISIVPREVPKEIVVRRKLSQTSGLLALLVLGLALVTGIGAWLYFVVLALVMAWLVFKETGYLSAERSARKAALDAAQRQWSAVVDYGDREGRQLINAFAKRLREIEGMAHEYGALPQRQKGELDALYQQREQLQKKAFLERFYIRDHKFQGIGTGLKNVLISYGVETAYDVRSAARVPGIGPARLATLMQWRRTVEARFRFDASQGINPSDVAAVNHKFQMKRTEVERALVQGKTELHHIALQSDKLLAAVANKLEPAARELAQATADYQLVR